MESKDILPTLILLLMVPGIVLMTVGKIIYDYYVIFGKPEPKTNTRRKAMLKLHNWGFVLTMMATGLGLYMIYLTRI